MHGGQAIPAFDFYLAPYVRNSYIEENQNLEELNGKIIHIYIRKNLQTTCNNRWMDCPTRNALCNMPLTRL